MVIEKGDEKRLTCCKTHKEKGADRRSTRTSHMVRNAKQHHFSETPINEETHNPYTMIANNTWISPWKKNRMIIMTKLNSEKKGYFFDSMCFVGLGLKLKKQRKKYWVYAYLSYLSHILCD